MVEIRKYMLEKPYRYEKKKVEGKHEKIWQHEFYNKVMKFFEFIDYETKKFYKDIIKIHIYYMTKTLKKISEENSFDENKFKEILEMLYFKNIILIITRTYKFLVDIKIELKQHCEFDFFLHFYATEETFTKIGKHLKYFLQLKPYAKKYKIYDELIKQKEAENKTKELLSKNYSSSNKGVKINEEANLLVENNIINVNESKNIELRDKLENENENEDEKLFKEKEKEKENDVIEKKNIAYDSAMSFRDQYISYEKNDLEDYLSYPPYETCNSVSYVKYKNFDESDRFIDTNKTNDLLKEFEDEYSAKEEKENDDKNPLFSFRNAMQKKYRLIPDHEYSIFRSIDKVRLLISSFDHFFILGKLFSHNHVKMDFHKRNEKVCHYKNKKSSLLCDSMNILSTKDSERFISHIRNYLGEEVAFYILWIQKLIYFILLPAVLGLICEILVKYFQSVDPLKKEYVFPFFILQIRPNDIIRGLLCITPPICISLFLKYWDEIEKIFTYIWGIEKSLKAEPYQESYKFDKEIDFIFNLKLKVQNKCIYYSCCLLSTLISIFMVGVVIAVNIWVLSLKQQNQNTKSYFWMYFPSALNAIAIKILSFSYRFFAIKLSYWENHERDSTRIANLSLKIFLFEFVNNFFTYYYIAFYKFYQTDKYFGCINNDCINEIEVQCYMSLGIIFSINFIEIGIPYLFNFLNLSTLKEKKKQEKKRNLPSDIMDKNIELSPEEISSLEDSEEMIAKMGVIDNLIEEYLEIIIYIAYILLLSSSAPLTPLLVIILLIFEKGVDTYKFYYLYRFRELRNFSTITIFNYMIMIVIFVGSFTNIGMFVFSRNFRYIDPKYEKTEGHDSINLLIKIFLFMILQNFVFIFNALLHFNCLPNCKFNFYFK